MLVHKKVEYLEAVCWHPGVAIKGLVEHNYGTKMEPKITGWIRGKMNSTSPVHDGDWVLATEGGVLSVVNERDFRAEYDIMPEAEPVATPDALTAQDAGGRAGLD